MAFDKKDTFALGRSIKKLEITNRIQDIENAALRIMEKAGHVVNEENPKELARILNEYYDGK